VRSEWLSSLNDAPVYLKIESLQLTGSFKARGAFNAVLQVAAAGARSLVTASAGNHGQALALAAASSRLPLTVFARRGAPANKLEAIERLGAILRADAATYDEAEEAAQAHAAATGHIYVSPYNDRDVIAGAGTIAFEIMEDQPDVEAIGVPVGGGGLLSGMAVACRALSPHLRIFGAEAAASPVFTTSLRNGRITPVAVADTIADGLAGNLDPRSITFGIVQRLVDEIVLVSEPDLLSAVRALASHERLVVEGAGAAGVAALLAGIHPWPSRPLALIVSGGNIDLGALRDVIG
jgi:threonine dehydratase